MHLKYVMITLNQFNDIGFAMSIITGHSYLSQNADFEFKFVNYNCHLDGCFLFYFFFLLKKIFVLGPTKNRGPSFSAYGMHSAYL